MRYESKDALKEAIQTAFDLYIAEFSNIPESLKDSKIAGESRTPAENLAYQVGWTTLLLGWERDEQLGKHVNTPSDDFRWNQLGELYQSFNDRYSAHSLDQLMTMLVNNIEQIKNLIDSLSEHELFVPHHRKWADDATKNALWPVAKFIHMNTVAPFRSFRTKIRKWKKTAQL